MRDEPLWKVCLVALAALLTGFLMAYLVARFVPWSAARMIACDYYSIDFEFCEVS